MSCLLEAIDRNSIEHNLAASSKAKRKDCCIICEGLNCNCNWIGEHLSSKLKDRGYPRLSRSISVPLDTRKKGAEAELK